MATVQIQVQGRLSNYRHESHGYVSGDAGMAALLEGFTHAGKHHSVKETVQALRSMEIPLDEVFEDTFKL